MMAHRNFFLRLLLFTSVVLFCSPAFLAGQAEAEAEEAQRPGHTVSMPDGSEVNLRVEDNRFRLYVYDEEGAQVSPVPYAFATIRVDGPSVDNEFYRLSPADDGSYLINPRFIRPPHNFRVWLNLFAEDEEEPVFNTNFGLRQ